MSSVAAYSEGDWSGRNCVNKDPQIFFPVTEQQIAAAKKVCKGCLLIRPCLELGIEADMEQIAAGKEPAGIWGGLTPEERAQETAKRLDLPDTQFKAR